MWRALKVRFEDPEADSDSVSDDSAKRHSTASLVPEGMRAKVRVCKCHDNFVLTSFTWTQEYVVLISFCVRGVPVLSANIGPTQKRPRPLDPTPQATLNRDA